MAIYNRVPYTVTVSGTAFNVSDLVFADISESVVRNQDPSGAGENIDQDFSELNIINPGPANVYYTVEPLGGSFTTGNEYGVFIALPGLTSEQGLNFRRLRLFRATDGPAIPVKVMVR